MRMLVELSESDVKKLIVNAISATVGYQVPPGDVRILVKSKQNYKSEWEAADIKAEYRDTKL